MPNLRFSGPSLPRRRRWRPPTFGALVALAVVASAIPREAGATIRSSIRFDGAAVRTAEAVDAPRVKLFHVPAGFEVADVRITPGTSRTVARTSLGRGRDASAEIDGEVPDGIPLVAGNLGGFRLHPVSLFPARSAASADSLQLTDSFDVELALRPTSPPDELIRRRAGGEAVRVFRRALEAIVANPEDLPPPPSRSLPTAPGALAPEELPSVEGTGVDMVIVTVPSLVASFQPLADWKTKKGVVTVIRTVDWIETNYPAGRDRPERIRLFLRDAYEKWGTYLVLLAGEHELVPSRALSLWGSSLTDQYYACLDGDWNGDGDSKIAEMNDNFDIYPDIFIARASVETPAEAATFVAKSFVYEKTPPPGYVEDHAVLAEVLFPDNWQCGYPPEEIELDGKTLAESLDVIIDPSWTRTKRYQSDCDLDRDIALDVLSAGHHLLTIIGHGDAFKFSVGDRLPPLVYIADTDTLTNGDALSFVVSVACNPNQIDLESIGESLMNNPNGGAIAVIGSSREDFASTAADFRAEMFRLLFDHGITGFGAISQIQRVPFGDYGGQFAPMWTSLSTMLLGDPELRLWTREPGTLLVTHAPTVALGTATIGVTVEESPGSPLADALVCVSDGAGTYSRARTGASGTAILSVGARSAGVLDVVVTSPEFLPYEGTCTVTGGVGPVLSVTGTVIDDDSGGASSGNGDGVLDVGETVELAASVFNGGGVNALGVGVTATVEAGANATFDLFFDGVRDAAKVFVGRHRANPVSIPFTLDFASPALDYQGAPTASFSPDSASGERGIFVWQDREGWHLRWSAAGDSVRVSGEIVTDGRVRWTDSLELESLTDSVVVSTAADTLAFSGWTHGRDLSDGIDFALADSTGLSVIAGSATLGDIGVGTTAAGTAVVAVSPTAREGQVAYLDLQLTATNDGPWGIELPLVFAAPSLEAYINGLDDSGAPPTVGNGNGVAEVGETVWWAARVLNRGSGAASGVTGALSATTGITFLDSTDSYGEIASHASSPGSDIYLFTLDDSTATSVDLTLTDAYGRQWVKSIDFVAPAAPDSLDFSPTPSRITLTWARNGEADLAGYLVYRSETSGSGYTSPSPFELLRTGSRYVDGDFTQLPALFYYRVTAVDSSGNESAPSAEIAAWTVQRQLAGWPQQAGGYVFGSVGLADGDGDGTGEVYVGSFDWTFRAWDATGTEIGQFPVTTENEIWATAAHADIDRDGNLEVLWGSRDTRFYAARVDGTPAFGDTVVFRHLAEAEEIRGTTSVADVDQDAELEFFFGTDLGNVYGFNHDGTGIADSTGLLFTAPPGNQNAKIWGPIAIADLAGDGNRKLVFASWNDSVYVTDPDGTRVSGFPRGATDEFRAGAILGDLDADGTMEIIAGNRDGGLYVFDHDGSDYVHAPGGILAVLPSEIRGPPALANLDGDPELEIVQGGFDGHLYAFEHDGTGFLSPDGVFAYLDSGEAISAGPIVVDVDGDSDFEVFIGHRNGNLYGFHHDAATVIGFPVPTNLSIYSTGAAGDLDGDGDVEIAFASWDQTVNVLDFDGPSNPAAYEWPTYAANIHRTAVYGELGPWQTGVDDPSAGGLAFSLFPGAPSPFRDATRIRFVVPREMNVELDVFDVTGRLVRSVVSGRMPAGRHEVIWDGRDGRGRGTASGVYFYRLEGESESRTRKVVRLR